MRKASSRRWLFFCFLLVTTITHQVPLDYAHPKGESAIIALVKRSARIPRADPRYKGPILVNPGALSFYISARICSMCECEGGPGGSGVSFVAIISGLLQASLGDEFDIIGFDPRYVVFRIFERV